MASTIISIMIVIWVSATMALRRASKGGNAAKRNQSSSKAAGKLLKEKIKRQRSGFRPPRSTDGHVLGEEQDITCWQFGHRHPDWEEPSTRYIVHDDIEDGYIILNGKKMLRTEADAYEYTI